MARMARSYSSRASPSTGGCTSPFFRGELVGEQELDGIERQARVPGVAQGGAWLSGSHHAAERDGYPKPVVAPYLKALRRSSVQLCAVYSSLGAWFFRAA